MIDRLVSFHPVNFIVVIVCLFDLWIYFHGKDSEDKRLMLFMMLIIPVSRHALYYPCNFVHFGSEASRIAWCIPDQLMIAFFAVDILRRLNVKRFWYGFAIFAFAIPMVLMASIFPEYHWQLPENAYMIGDDVMEATDIILDDVAVRYYDGDVSKMPTDILLDDNGEPVSVIGYQAFELMFRQYAPTLVWGYTDREYMLNADRYDNGEAVIARAIRDDNIDENDVDVVYEKLESLGVNYLVIKNDNSIMENLPIGCYSQVGNGSTYSVYHMTYH